LYIYSNEQKEKRRLYEKIEITYFYGVMMFEFTNPYYLLFLLALFVVAILYSSVGHGGASGYLAVLALASLPVQTMKLNALFMNCFVSLIAFLFFSKSRKINWQLFFYFAAASIPCSFIGSSIKIEDHVVKIILGLTLLFSIVYINGWIKKKEELTPFNPVLCLVFGSVIGLLSGMLGIGGGVLLSPLLLLLGWAKIGETAGISALFIFVNSLSGIAGQIYKKADFSVLKLEFIPIVVVGALIGAFVGSKKLEDKYLKIVLSIILLTAGLKLVLEGF
jgi:uncharacterized membrane protein YfcA